MTTAAVPAPLDSPTKPAPTKPFARPWTIDALLTPTTRWLSVAIVAVSFVFPVHGLGVDLCMLHATTGLPCPGCGMSRAISAISQGDFVAAAGLNPFSFIFWPMFVGLAVLAVLPKPKREFLESKLRAVPFVGRAYFLLCVAFLAFGVMRLAVFVALNDQHFP